MHRRMFGRIEEKVQVNLWKLCSEKLLDLYFLSDLMRLSQQGDLNGWDVRNSRRDTKCLETFSQVI